MSRLDEIKAEQVARIFADLGRNRIQQAMSESQESKGSPEWHRFGQGRWAFTHAASVVNKHLGYPVDIWGEWIEEWSPHDLSDKPVLDPAEQEHRDLLAEIKARIEAKLAEWPDFFHNVRSPLSAAETLRIIEQVEALTAERDALAREADALRAKVAAVEALPDEWMALTSTVLATKQEHWRGDDYVDGREFGIETCADSLRAALATTGEGQ